MVQVKVSGRKAYSRDRQRLGDRIRRRGITPAYRPADKMSTLGCGPTRSVIHCIIHSEVFWIRESEGDGNDEDLGPEHSVRRHGSRNSEQRIEIPQGMARDQSGPSGVTREFQNGHSLLCISELVFGMELMARRRLCSQAGMSIWYHVEMMTSKVCQVKLLIRGSEGNTKGESCEITQSRLAISLSLVI